MKSSRVKLDLSDVDAPACRRSVAGVLQGAALAGVRLYRWNVGGTELGVVDDTIGAPFAVFVLG